MKSLTLLALAALVTATPVLAEAPPVSTATGGHVATLVVVKTPAGVTRAMIEAGFVKSAPGYRRIPGLLRKYFTVNDQGFGGMYLWSDRKAAEAWFTPEWRAKAKATYGTEPELTYFDTPLQIDMVPEGKP